MRERVDVQKVLDTEKTKIAASVAPKAAPMVWNVVGGGIKSGFGRVDKPGARTVHIGNADASYDSYAKAGTPINQLPAGGTVKTIGRNNERSGNSVYLDYGNGAGVQVYHMGDISAKPGQKITDKDVIGTVGATGYSPSGAHASYKFFKDGKVVPANVAFPDATFPEEMWGKQGGGSWGNATSFDPKTKTFYSGDKAVGYPGGYNISSNTGSSTGASGTMFGAATGVNLAQLSGGSPARSVRSFASPADFAVGATPISQDQPAASPTSSSYSSPVVGKL